jgi:acyl-[acyl-carrier-protein] desaturase
LDKIYFLISRDEAAHRGFYQKLLQFELEEDREGALEDLAKVAFNFVMPGVGLIPEYEERLNVLGVGISPQYFLQHGIFPLLRAVGTNRAELIKATRRAKEKESAPVEQEAAEMAVAGD